MKQRNQQEGPRPKDIEVIIGVNKTAADVPDVALNELGLLQLELRTAVIQLGSRLVEVPNLGGVGIDMYMLGRTAECRRTSEQHCQWAGLSRQLHHPDDKDASSAGKSSSCVYCWQTQGPRQNIKDTTCYTWGYS